MTIYTSYFYQVRNFPRTLLPVSTAYSDAKWYHQFGDKETVFVDSRGVVNGLRADLLVPITHGAANCVGQDVCRDAPLDTCPALQTYYRQLQSIDFQQFIATLEKMVVQAKSFLNLSVIPDVALLVHEAVGNPCSERVAIQRWFADNDYAIDEWHL